MIQNYLLEYLRREFKFSHLNDGRVGDSVHIHVYKLSPDKDGLGIELEERLSTDAAGVAECLGLQAESKIELETLIADLERKMSQRTLLTLGRKPLPVVGELPAD